MSFFVKKDIPKSIWAISFATFLINIATLLAFTLSTCFMQDVLCLQTGTVGFLQNFVDSFSFIMKLLSGFISDFVRRRKSLVIFGFLIITIAKPTLGLATTPAIVFLARAIDRLGNGIQSTPRDALIGDIAPKNLRGHCFGLSRGLATMGSFLAGVSLLFFDYFPAINYSSIFFAATIPCFLGTILVLIFVKDSFTDREIKKHYEFPLQLDKIKKLDNHYWFLILIVFVFMLSRYGEASLLMFSRKYHNLSQFKAAGLTSLIYNGTAALVAYPTGIISDKVNRGYLLVIGYLVMMIASGMLAISQSFSAFIFGIVLWGMQIGITQNIFMGLITDYVPKELRGTGFGMFYLISAISLFCSGLIWQKATQTALGMRLAYAIGMGISFFALILVVIFLIPKRISKNEKNLST